jgi:hypothetical protein
VPVRRRESEEVTRHRQEEQQWADKGVQVAFEAPEDTVSWSLHDQQTAFVCNRPCSSWLGPSSGYFVRRNEVKASGLENIPVPAGQQGPC